MKTWLMNPAFVSFEFSCIHISRQRKPPEFSLLAHEFTLDDVRFQPNAPSGGADSSVVI
jgi:hypothetical protein